MSTFWIILTGALVASTCGIVGCFLVLRKMAMIGDAISHAVLPGIVIAFLISGSRDSLFMMLGAAAIGLITVFLIQLFHQSGVQSDAAIGVVFTALFAVGVVLISIFTKSIDLDLDCVLYGEIAYVPWNTLHIGGIDIGPKAVWGVGLALLLTIIMISLFYKQFKICSFDPAMAAAVGIPVMLFHYLLMGLVSISTVASFESVGAILVVGMLVIPPATAYLLTEKLSRMIIYSIVMGCCCSVLGYYVAHLLDASIAGSMICIAGCFFILALFFSPTHGVIVRKWKQKQLIREDIIQTRV
ncbi:manganese/zinc/iron transport system permease protein [Paenibacillus sp. 1_12]|uniref:metal ABC transporter permease n=1 Tax=Paenibacillus sp. 1_12 TaxID=1566278 RepID=UPI0008F13780|nr:metal ABC transporter permease [Paenibacillus sp. 1_12]SFK69215.1 manganese/zinc/iron transport system permease protein [Paenibacillus sp. 1_12]